MKKLGESCSLVLKVSISRFPGSGRAWCGCLLGSERRTWIPVLVPDTRRDLQCHGSNDKEESHSTVEGLAAESYRKWMTCLGVIYRILNDWPQQRYG